jgi:hypothetical protein
MVKLTNSEPVSESQEPERSSLGQELIEVALNGNLYGGLDVPQLLLAAREFVEWCSDYAEGSRMSEDEARREFVAFLKKGVAM